MNINYAELYGVKPNESDFRGAIRRSLKNGISHLSKEYLRCIVNLKKH